MWRWILATLFLIGFTLGTAYISLPFSIALVGFWPGVIALVLSWAYLVITGFYYLEAVLAAPPGSNAYSISRRYIGRGGAWITSLIFGLVFYGYLVYFFFIIEPLLSPILSHTLHITLSSEVILALIGLLVGVIIFLGMYFTVLVNAFFFILMGIFYTLGFEIGFKEHVSLQISQYHWWLLFLSIPAVLDYLYLHTLIPSVAQFLEYRKRPLQSAIVVALGVSFLSFIAWFWLVMASDNHTNSLIRLNLDTPITYDILAKIPVIGKWLPALLIANVLMSLLSTGTLLVDFLADLARITPEKRRGVKRLILCACAIIPNILLCYLVPGKPLLATSLYITEAGGVYLSGLLPVLWVWALRYFHNEKAPILVPGGKKMLTLFSVLTAFALYLVVLQIFYQITF